MTIDQEPMVAPDAARRRPARPGLPTEPPLGPRPFRELDDATPLGAHARLVLALATLAVLATVGIAVAADLPVLRGWAVAVFLLTLVGVGPTLLIGRLTALWFTALSITLSLSLTIAIGFLMALTRVWAPEPALAVVGVLSAITLVVAVGRDVLRLRRERAGGASVRPVDRRSVMLVAALTLAGVLACVVSAVVAATVTGGIPQPGGLMSVLPWPWFVGAAAVIAAVVVAGLRRVSPAFPILVLSAIVVGSQAIVYASPTVMSAARHVGIVDYIRVNGAVDVGRDIYQAWSGLFAGIAWVADAGHITDAMALATWWPVVISPALAAAVALLASRWIADRFRMWFAALLFVLTSTLNIIYFSPQSIGLLLALVVFALLVEPRREKVPRSERRRGTYTLGIGRPLLVLFLASVMAVTHQISPYLSVAALGILLLFGYIRPWWSLLLVLGPALAWALSNTAVLGRFVSLGAVGRLWENVKPPQHSFTQLPTPAVTGFAFSLPAAALFVLGLAALAVLVVRRSRPALALALAAASPAALFVATDYGQEGIFRVVLFAGPWLAVLAVALPWPDRLRRLAVPLVGVAAVLLLAINAFGQTALDWNRVVARDAADATQEFERIAQDDGLALLTGTGNATPLAISSRYFDVGYLSRESIGGYPDPSREYNADADVAGLTQRFVSSWDAAEYFAIVSNSIGAYNERYGFQSYEDYEKLAAAMERSRYWTKVTSGPTTTLYVLSADGRALISR